MTNKYNVYNVQCSCLVFCTRECRTLNATMLLYSLFIGHIPLYSFKNKVLNVVVSRELCGTEYRNISSGSSPFLYPTFPRGFTLKSLASSTSLDIHC